MFPNDVGLAFIAGDGLDDADGELAKLGDFVGAAVKALVLGVEALARAFTCSSLDIGLVLTATR